MQYVDIENLSADRKKVRLANWEISPIDFGIFLCLVFSSLYAFSASVLNLYIWYFEPTEESTAVMPTIVAGYGMQLGGIVGYLAFNLLIRSPRRDNPSSTLTAIGTGAIGVLVTYLALVTIAPLWKMLLQSLEIAYEYQEPVKMVLEGGTPMEVAFMYTLIVLGAPLGEEFVFRAGIFRYLHHKVPLYASVGISSILFALLHFNLYSFLPLAIVGAVLCLVYRRTGNLLACITLHSLFNLINLIFILKFPELSQ